MTMPLLLNIITLCVLVSPGLTIHWLAIAKGKQNWNKTSQCIMARKYLGLRGRQVSICQRHLEVMPHLVGASKDTSATCMRAFVDRRWNCSSITSAPNLTADLTKGTREQAYAYALASAAIAHTIARACSDGSLVSCGCGHIPHEPPHGDFKWGGCAHNVRYGLKFTRSFTDAPWRQKSVRRTIESAMNRHNNQAGRRAIRSSLQTDCKCHGVSGSCNIKTCWRALPRLRDIGERLKRKYHIATEVVQRHVGTRKKLMPANSKLHMFNKNDLIFVSKSPDYCMRDPKVGSLGTHGRACNASSQGTDGCDSMCCGRGYRTFTTEKLERCHCKYYWCCYVKCKTCRSWVDVQECV